MASPHCERMLFHFTLSSFTQNFDSKTLPVSDIQCLVNLSESPFAEYGLASVFHANR